MTISGASSPTSSNTEPVSSPDNDCPICGGLRYVTRNVPTDHPDFGKAFPCVCQQETIAARRDAQLRALSNLDVVADKTFDTFTLDRPTLSPEQLGALQSAYQHARNYAENPEGWLLFQGNFGSGKTHLAVAIANYRLEHGESVLFMTVPDLLDHLRSTFAPSSEAQYDELFERVRNTPLLVLDDLGAESATPWAQEKLFQLINHRYLHQHHTVITTNVELDKLDPRIRSRLVDRELTQGVLLPLPDYRRSDLQQDMDGLANLGLYGEMVFENFDLRNSSLPEKERRNLKSVFEIAMNYAQNPQGWLVFLGEHGCGKTHLAAAIANYRHRQGEQVILVTTPDLLDYLRATFAPSSGVTFSKRFHEIREAALLVIDNLDTTNATPWAREKIHQIVDHRYLAHLPTVFTTTQRFEDMDALLRSRLLDGRLCRVLAILAPDYAGGNTALYQGSRRK
jgi:DNA replication protein DnaC